MTHRKYQGLRSKWIAKTTIGAAGFLAFLGLATETQAQDITWNGGTGNWFDILNWDLGSAPGITNNVRIDGGDAGNSIVNTGNGASITIAGLEIDLGDTLNIGNNSSFRIDASGTITNDGTINLTNAGNNANFVIRNSVTLDGNGSLVLGGTSETSRIVDDANSDGHLTNSSTIQGKGQIGANTLQLTNAADGVIEANVAGSSLTIDTNANGATNQGEMKATGGGTLLLTGATAVDNTGGVIRAENGSTVSLAGGSSVTGGEITSAGTGTVKISDGQSASIANATLSGTITQNNNSNLSLDGNIANSGNLSVNNLGNNTDLIIDGNTNLTGGGTITLGGNSATSRILDETGDALGVLTNTDNTIQGKGIIGSNRTEIINSGLIDANDNTGTLTLDPRNTGDQFTNTGTLRASNGAQLVLDGFGGGRFLNDGGRIEAQDNSTVRLQGIASVDQGTLESFGSGRFVVGPNQNAELEDVDFIGQMDVENNTDLELFSSLNNQGIIRVTNAGNDTDIQVNSAVSLTGGGTITLGGISATSRILDETGDALGVLTNTDNTIQGKGLIGLDRTEIINQSLIDANDSTGSLTLDPRDTGAQFTNTGTLRASNGAQLVLDGSGGGRFLNDGGRIEAQDNSTVRLQGIASVDQGTLESFGSGRFVVGPNQNAELEDVDFIGQMDVENNTDLELIGSLNNQGIIRVTNAGNNSDIQVNSAVSLNGGGTITLGGISATSRILDEFGAEDGVLTNVDNTIQGKGFVGFDRTEIVNQSLINANDSTGTLTLDPRDTGAEFTNTGTLRASNGGRLILDGGGGGDFLNSGGRIEALDGSTVVVEDIARIDGGELESFGSGRFLVDFNQNAELKDVDFSGQFDVRNNSDLELFGTINNQGSIALSNLGNNTDIQIESGVSLVGGGTITLGGNSATGSRILDESGATDGVLTNVDNTIGGAGNIGFNRMGLINQVGGTITANVGNSALIVDQIGTSFSNQGTLVAESTSTLLLEDDLINSGVVRADGTVNIDTNNFTNSLGGTIQGSGLIDADILNEGTIGPGNSVGTLTVDGDVTLASTSLFDVELDSSGADLLDVMGTMNLDGNLSISLLSSFEPDELDSFVIAMSNMDIMGDFDNVLNGGELMTEGGEGTFVVNYGAGSAFAANSIVLSGFTAAAVPEPGTATAMFALLTSSLLVRRRRRESLSAR